MKEPNIAPAYVTLYPGLCDVARSHGYALAIHGSLITDMDCVAVAWTNEISSKSILAENLKWYLSMLFPESTMSEPEQKPYGRVAYLFDLGNGAQLDLSIVGDTNNED